MPDLHDGGNPIPDSNQAPPKPDTINRTWKIFLMVFVPIIGLIMIVSWSRWMFNESEYVRSAKRTTDSLILENYALRRVNDEKAKTLKQLDSVIHERFEILQSLDTLIYYSKIRINESRPN